MGSDTYNIGLSQRRAQSVVRWLGQQGGVATARLQPLGRGEQDPVASNTRPDGSDDPSGRARNRRVKIYVPR